MSILSRAKAGSLELKAESPRLGAKGAEPRLRAKEQVENRYNQFYNAGFNSQVDETGFFSFAAGADIWLWVKKTTGLAIRPGWGTWDSFRGTESHNDHRAYCTTVPKGGIFTFFKFCTIPTWKTKVSARGNSRYLYKKLKWQSRRAQRAQGRCQIKIPTIPCSGYCVMRIFLANTCLFRANFLL